MRYVVEHIDDPIQLDTLSALAGMPENTLTRYFNRLSDMSPIRWVWHLRTVVAARLIMSQPRTSLTDIALHCGFNSSAHFSRRFRAMFGIAPRTFRHHFLQATLRPQSDEDLWIGNRLRSLVADSQKTLNFPAGEESFLDNIGADFGCSPGSPM